MKLRRSLLIVSLVLVLLPLSCWAQETPKAELFAGYSYLRIRPDGTAINMHGFDTSIAGNVNHWFGLVADFGYYRSHNLTPSADGISYLFGPRFSYRKNEKVTPFFQTLFGGIHAGANGQRKPNDFAMTVGGGVDINVHRNIAIRPFQLEYFMVRDSGTTLNNLRFASGLVFRFGYNPPLVVPKHPTATCSVDSSSIMQGKTANVSAVVSDLDLATVTYSWSTSGGNVTGSGSAVVFDSAGANPGTYTVTAKVSDKEGNQATCSVNVVVEAVPVPPKPNSNPAVSCSVDRASVMEGESTRAHATASDPDGDPLTYEWTTSAGRLTGTGADVTFNSAGVTGGTTVTVGAMVSDGRGGTANCSSTIQVNALPPKPKPQPISCLSAGFPRNLARINNVDKACLDDVSLKMQNDPRSTLIITGYADASEAAAKALAKKRAESAKAYLVKEQKLDPSRINVQSAAPLKGKGVDEEKGNRRVEIMFYPEGTEPK